MIPSGLSAIRKLESQIVAWTTPRWSRSVYQSLHSGRITRDSYSGLEFVDGRCCWSEVVLGEACDDLPEGRFQGVSVTAAVQRVADAAKWIATGPWRVYRFLSQECN